MCFIEQRPPYEASTLTRKWMKHLPGAEAAPEQLRSRPSDACAEGSHQITVEGGMDNTRGEKIRPRPRILSVAAELFHRHGIRSVGVGAIAEAADTSKMTFYRHFASKDELIAHYLRHFTELAHSERPEPVDPAEALMLLRTWLSEMADHLNDPDGRGCRFAPTAARGNQNVSKCLNSRKFEPGQCHDLQ
jgi:Bacterial regulatory proteins, tetR family